MTRPPRPDPPRSAPLLGERRGFGRGSHMHRKPKLRIVSPDYAAITYRDFAGSVEQYKPGFWCGWYETGPDLPNRRTRESIVSPERAIEAVIAGIDPIADCRDLSAQVDELENQGLRTRIGKVGGDRALLHFDGGLAQVQAWNPEGLPIVRGMIKAVAGRRLPTEQSVTLAKRPALKVVPGFSVEFEAGPIYYIGGQAEYDSYNLHYFGEITTITTRTVAIRPRAGSGTRRLRMDEFAWRNEAHPSGPGGKYEQNHETMMCI